MPDAFLQKYIAPALQLHSRGWKTWAQGEQLQTAGEFVRNQVEKLPPSAQNLAFSVGAALWGGGEALDALVGQKISGPQLLEMVQHLDQGLLRQLQNKGFLKMSPKVVYAFSSSEVDSPGQTLPYSDGWGEIKMFLKSSGRLTHTSSSPNTLAHQMNKWMILLHEAAHGEFYTSPEIFQLHKGDVSADEVHLINTWGMNRLFNSFASKVLAENFADGYGAMMLLEGFGHSEESVQAVTNLAQLRAAHAQEEPYGAYCACHLTLSLLLKDRHLWAGQAPSVLQNIARQYSSAALMVTAKAQDFTHPQAIVRHLVSEKMAVLPILFEFCLECTRSTSDTHLAQLDKTYADVPIWPHIRTMCQTLAEQLHAAQSGEISSLLHTALQKNTDPHLLVKEVFPLLAQHAKRMFIELDSTSSDFQQVCDHFKAVQQYFRDKFAAPSLGQSIAARRCVEETSSQRPRIR